MIQQELVQNPVLEEGTEIVEKTERNSGTEAGFTDAEAVAEEADDTKYKEVNEREVTVEETSTPSGRARVADDPYGDIDFRASITTSTMAPRDPVRQKSLRSPL